MELCLAMKENHCVSLRRAKQRGVELVHIQPRKPTQNAYIERFNRSLQTGVLDRYVFTSLNEVRRMTTVWQHAITTTADIETSAAFHPPPLPKTVFNERGRYTYY